MKKSAVVCSGALAALVAVAYGPAQALADAVSCGDVITKNAKLENDLVCPLDQTRPGLTIGADGVKLDLAGHSITTHYDSVLNDGHDNVTIEGGSVLSYAGSPIRLRHADNNRIVHIHTSGGTGPGIRLEDADHNRMVRSSGGADDGAVGLWDGSDHNMIERNALGAGLGVAVWISNSDGNVIRRNDVNGGGYGGLSIQAGSDDTTVKRNLIHGGGGDASPPESGIHVFADSRYTRLIRNKVRNYLGSGIRVESPSAILTRNSSDDNGEWGILAVPGVTDGGHNTASGNGVGQCLNVTC